MRASMPPEPECVTMRSTTSSRKSWSRMLMTVNAFWPSGLMAASMLKPGAKFGVLMCDYLRALVLVPGRAEIGSGPAFEGDDVEGLPAAVRHRARLVDGDCPIAFRANGGEQMRGIAAPGRGRGLDRDRRRGGGQRRLSPRRRGLRRWRRSSGSFGRGRRCRGRGSRAAGRVGGDFGRLIAHGQIPRASML